jgi:hypothetical protein
MTPITAAAVTKAIVSTCGTVTRKVELNKTSDGLVSTPRPRRVDLEADRVGQSFERDRAAGLAAAGLDARQAVRVVAPRAHAAPAGHGDHGAAWWSRVML